MAMQGSVNSDSIPEVRDYRDRVLLDLSVWRSALGLPDGPLVQQLTRLVLGNLLDDYRVMVNDWVYFSLLREAPEKWKAEWMMYLDAIPRLPLKKTTLDIALQLTWELRKNGFSLNSQSAINAAQSLQYQIPLYTLDPLHDVLGRYRRVRIFQP